MTRITQDIITKFDHLPIDEQKEVIKIILRRNIDIETPVLSDDELTLNAEGIFLEFDRREEKEEAIDAES